MIGLFHVELDKLRTVRTTWLLLAFQQLTVLASLAGLVAVGADLHVPTALRQLMSQAGFMSSLFSLVLGILASLASIVTGPSPTPTSRPPDGTASSRRS